MPKKPAGPSTPVVFRSKLGTAKGVERSRIWIEGKRLVDAGFKVGSYFTVFGVSGGPDSSLGLLLAKPGQVFSRAPSKVTGTRTRPVIDITGEIVRTMFGVHGTHVDVVFSKGEITIRRAKEA
jgi:hypothetical protein